MQAQLWGNRQSPEAFPGAWQAPRLFCDTSNREGRICWSQDLVVISATKLLQVSCWSQARGRPFLKLWIVCALGIYFTVGLMLSKGLLPLKRVVLFLAMSLPVQCMSFLWSWSSVRWASSLQCTRTNICVVCMRWLSWCGCRQGRGAAVARAVGACLPLWQWFQQWLPTSTALWDVWAQWCCGSSAWAITVLKQKSSEAEPRTGLMGGPSLPQTHLLHDLSLLGPESSCSAGGSLPGAQSPHSSTLSSVCTGQAWLECRGTSCQFLGLFRSVFNAWSWLVALLAALLLKQAFPHVSAARPSLLPK